MTWNTTALDLEAYLVRIGASEEEPSLVALSRLQTAHARTFPFENLDVLLAQHQGVSLAAVQEKFVQRRRGGYCFEHATLFHAVLDRLGYHVQPHLARVGDPDAAPRTHLDLVVELDGRRYLVDPGIGVPPLGPIELRDGGELRGGLWPHRIRATQAEQPGGVAWELWRNRTGKWERMHVTDELPVRPVDVEMGHHWTSTAPASHFRRSLTVNQHGVASDGTPALTTITHETVTVGRRGERPQARPYALDELPDLLGRATVALNIEETIRLTDRVRDLRRISE
ncbi:arylamine N-acetyltransferase family protein [Demetria terragena]|uniref:arylamine N-acetyltransferase family protein n=1 Tax=Demetria terragena TaxID=63959 RepID=UPI000371BB87|nr:arylamine N-acetyltransferase [Demetria terragena]